MIDRRWAAGFREIATVGLVAGLLAASPLASGLAQTAAVFEVARVAVDVTAETAAAAREKALANGEATAFRRLLERLTLRADHGRLPKLVRDQVAAYVIDFSVADEKTSAVRYLASLTFRFKAEAVRRLLIDHGLSFAETSSKPVIVLPVYQAAGALLLWDDPNPWREAWRANPAQDGLVPLIVPAGDLADIAAIGAEQAVNGDSQRLAAVAARYGGDDALVAHATLGIAAQRGSPELEVLVTRYGGGLNEQTIGKTFSTAAGEGLDALLRRAAADLARQVEDNWRRDNLLQFGQSAVLAVTVPIKGLAEWLEVRKRLSGVAVVRRVDLVLLSRDEVRINVHYIGERSQLGIALRQADLVLSEQGDDHILGLARPSAAGKT